jgi:predicted RNA-binding protein with PUA-like domain
MRHWLMKTEPESFSVEDLAAAPRSTTFWDGVRNFQARNMLRDEIKRGDQVFMYYSSTDVPGIVAIMDVVKDGYPDATAFDKKHHHYDSDSDSAQPRWFG